MPELPEVETIKNEISPYIIGRRISGITLPWEGIVKEPSAEEFCSRVTGRKIMSIVRRGKYLLVNLDSSDTLILHMKMSGSLLIVDGAAEPPKYTRAIVCLDNGRKIFFRDPRKFGVMRLVKDGLSVVSKLGPEPLEASFTPEVLARLLAKRVSPIKALLSDQQVIAGIGNMYADEALFAAKIHPLRPGGSLTKDEIKRLYGAIIKVLKLGLFYKGASERDYVRPDGTKGTAHSQFKIAHRGGELCPNCGTPIQRTTVRNRGTYFCPKCQPAR
ncbi:MAG: bifunctional DNA-formamidopyrimidine glycosylase/DNA-(apurinic or apyrimidinic site) lyase [Chloroflexota bacterium]